MILVDAVEIAVYAYLTFFVLYFFMFSFAGRLFSARKTTLAPVPEGSFLILIPAYREDAVLLSTVSKALGHNYSADKFDVVVIADGLQEETLRQLAGLPVRVIESTGPRRSKAIAINTALDALEDRWDYVMVLDADNVMAQGCLRRINHHLAQGIAVVQGRRTAKNDNTSLAVLDGLSEEINNHIFRRGHRALGLSSALIGSGMAFRARYFRQLMAGIEDACEDRELELRILRDRHLIEYAEDAVIYDEKVSTPHVFLHQRSKWLSGQFRFLRKSLTAHRGNLSGNLDLLNKIVQSMSPPRSILLGILPLLLLLAINHIGHVPQSYIITLLAIYLASLVMAVPATRVNRKMLRACWSLPYSIAMMVAGCFRSLQRRKRDFHTPHRVH